MNKTSQQKGPFGPDSLKIDPVLKKLLSNRLNSRLHRGEKIIAQAEVGIADILGGHGQQNFTVAAVGRSAGQ